MHTCTHTYIQVPTTPKRSIRSIHAISAPNTPAKLLDVSQIMKKHFADVVINAPGDRKGVVKDKGGAWKERVTALTAAEGALRAVKPLGGAGPYVDVQCGDMWLGAKVRCVCVCG